MGSASSSQTSSSSEDNVHMKQLVDLFSRFIEANCTQGSDKCVHIQKLESAFAYYLNKNIDSKKLEITLWPGTIGLVHVHMQYILRQNRLELSPGYVVDNDMHTVHIDTRYVIGLDVVRF